MPSADEILQRMRDLQERREAAAKPLVDILAERSRLLEQLAELDEPYGKAYVAAEAAGWTAEDLAQLGAEEPARRPRVRSRRARSSARKADSQPTPTAPGSSSPAVAIPSQDGAAAATATADSAASA
ncbi:hypothetical protein OOK44_36650 [Streptomyces cellulosae]|uniref:hypothetical protein n=1 Tax=Streptomyces TaxID=1883 RepID=UPI002253A03B|nr:hypothetical protein [Streptomyces cellulosae]WTC60987.1 hypothetical protein OH715_37330 [Streptomyces cellulosae]